MMRIGIMGAQGVGKTTLLNALRSEPYFKDFTVCNEVTRKVKSLGFPINEDGNDITQELIVREHLFNLAMYDNFITDRTLVDSYVYTNYLQAHHKVTSNVLMTSLTAMIRNIGKYNHLFFIRPEFNLVNDGVRSLDIKFRDEIDYLFQEVVSNYLEDGSVHLLTGSVVKRVEQIKKVVGINE